MIQIRNKYWTNMKQLWDKYQTNIKQILKRFDNLRHNLRLLSNIEEISNQFEPNMIFLNKCEINLRPSFLGECESESFSAIILYLFSCLEFCETQPPASIGWVALSSVIGWLFGCSSRIRDTSSHLHYMMFPSIQTIYFLWGYDPGNMSVPTYLLLLSRAQFTVV